MNTISSQSCKIHSFPFEVLYFQVEIKIHEEGVFIFLNPADQKNHVEAFTYKEGKRVC